MKTKFAPVVQVAKFRVDALERELQQLQARIDEVERDRQQLYDELAAVRYPQSGTLAQMQGVRECVLLYHRQIQEATQLKIILEEGREKLRQKIAQATIEYEKMLHLDKQEREQMTKLLQKREAARLDEVGLNLHVNRSFS